MWCSCLAHKTTGYSNGIVGLERTGGIGITEQDEAPTKPPVQHPSLCFSGG